MAATGGSGAAGATGPWSNRATMAVTTMATSIASRPKASIACVFFCSARSCSERGSTRTAKTATPAASSIHDSRSEMAAAKMAA